MKILLPSQTLLFFHRPGMEVGGEEGRGKTLVEDSIQTSKVFSLWGSYILLSIFYVETLASNKHSEEDRF